MKLKELGELGLIQRIAQLVGPPGPEVLVGIGDDAAAWKVDSPIQLATTDSLVEGVHFLLDRVTWEDLGWKAMAVNLSDVAAMGGVPRYALVSLGLPADREIEEIASFYRGLLLAARQYGVAIIGGDLHASPHIVITLTLLGQLEGEALLSRAAARPGEQMAVTGNLGSSAGGLALLKQELKLDEATASYLRQAHLRPQPRVKEGRALLRCGVRAAIDISDGLLRDLGHICRLSGVGARIRVDQVPIHPKLRQAFGEKALALALSGGEDYELLFTAPREVMARVKEELPLYIIGELTPVKAQIELTDEKGRPFPWKGEGWEHFVSGGSDPEP